MIVVLDASVILKWMFADQAREPDTDQAVALEQDDALLVTADMRYLTNAERYGSVLALGDVETIV